MRFPRFLRLPLEIQFLIVKTAFLEYPSLYRALLLTCHRFRTLMDSICEKRIYPMWSIYVALKDGCAHGPYRTWILNRLGDIGCNRFWKLHGYRIQIAGDQSYMVTFYVDGSREGEKMYVDSAGRLERTVHYKDDKKHGLEVSARTHLIES